MSTHPPSTEAGPKKVQTITRRLYTGEDLRGMPLGELLKKKSREGREVVRQQSTRWAQNRSMFRGDQHISANPSSNQVRALQRDAIFSNNARNRRDTFNRLRQFTEGRVSMMTGEKPSFTVDPPDNDPDSISAARLATKFLKAMWDQEGWKIQSFITKLCLTGEIDGITWAYVGWNKNKQRKVATVMLTEEGQQFLAEHGTPYIKKLVEELATKGLRPVMDRRIYEFITEADPEGSSLWENDYKRMGDVEFRVVRPGAIACDPFASDPDDIRWVCESSILPKAQIEQIAPKELKKIFEEGRKTGTDGEKAGDGSLSSSKSMDVNVDDGDPQARQLPGRDAVLCHRMYHLPDGDFPLGVHVFWADQHPEIPIIMEPYDEDVLPYRPFCPKPDHGHFIRSRGTVDDLVPMQVRLNRTLQMLHTYLDRVGNPPVAMPRGALASESLYNEKGFFEYHPGLGEGIHVFQTPGEPVAFLTQHLGWIEQQMAEVAAQSASARGQANQHSPEAAVGINMQIQQTEQQLSGTESALKQAIEWAVSRALVLVGKYYTEPRMVSTPGVDTTSELRAFNREMVKGASRFRIDGSLLPNSKAAQWQAMMQFIPMLGPEARPWIPDFLTGDIEEFKSVDRANKEKQKRENQQLAAVAGNEKARTVWADFQEKLDLYMKALQGVQQAMPSGSDPAALAGQEPGAMAGGAGPMLDPKALVQRMGVQEPNFTQDLLAAGIDVPVVEDFDVHASHLTELNVWRVGDSFDVHPEMVKQLAREHNTAHLDHMARSMMQMGAGMGAGEGGPGQPSPPAEKGQPSPPAPPGQASQPGGPGGAGPKAPPTGGPTSGG